MVEENRSQFEDAGAIPINRYRKIWMDFYEAKDEDIVFLVGKILLKYCL